MTMSSPKTNVALRPTALTLGLSLATVFSFPGGCRSGDDDNNGTEADADADDDADLDVDVDTDMDTDTDANVGSMVPVPAGTFLMGSPEGEWGRTIFEVQHPVTLTHGYEIGAYEVTQKEFEDAVGYNYSENYSCPLCPVENLTWHEAAAYANAVSDAAGVDRCYSCSGDGVGVACTPLGSPYDCGGYRLPTEAEWEKATRGSTTSAFSNGGDLTEADCHGNLALTVGVLDDIAVYCGDSRGRPLKVGSTGPNPIGLYDVHGNIEEWCHDASEEKFPFYMQDAETDPWGEAKGTLRALRSGAYSAPANDVRSASRAFMDSFNYNPHIGFRLARTE
jgi:formylglycine-generating enzyme required for sulfatase activity